MIDTKAFFKLGIVCFTIIGLANLTNFFIFYNQNNIFSHLASAASIFFNFVTAAFFYYLLKTTTTSIIDDNDNTLNDLKEEFNKWEKKTLKQKKN